MFPADVSREEGRELEARYLEEAEDPAFTDLDFDRFAEALRRNRERFRRWFFLTTGL